MSIHDAKKQLEENAHLLKGKADLQSLVLLNLSQALRNICTEIDRMKSTISSIDTKVGQIKSSQ
jgi:hypothetical protein